MSSLSMESPMYAPFSPTSPGKRSIDNNINGRVELSLSKGRHSITSYSGSTSPEDYDPDEISTAQHRDYRSIDGLRAASKTRTSLTQKQVNLLRQWYKDFAQSEVVPSRPNESMIALATAMQSQPQLVLDYIKKRHKDDDGMERSVELERLDRRSPRSAHAFDSTSDPYNLAEANDHLPPIVLSLVEKYVSACRRRRSQNDGRRSVNTGPFKCTFGCGYRTKRAFDWRRHEETHEPQELWLCTLCSQKDSQNPFLVNRKDKFLKHVNDKHEDWAAEKVLDSSKVAFVPRAELRCPYCGTDSGNWDERCRHVLGHFEDEVERSAKRVRVALEEQEDMEPVPGDSASVES